MGLPGVNRVRCCFCGRVAKWLSKLGPVCSDCKKMVK
jgi:hypothetical protein